MYSSVQDFMLMIENKNPNEVEFHQAVREVVDSLWDFLVRIKIIFILVSCSESSNQKEL